MKRTLLSLLFIGLFTSHTTFGMDDWKYQTLPEVDEASNSAYGTSDDKNPWKYIRNEKAKLWKDLLENHILFFMTGNELLRMKRVSKNFSAFIETIFKNSNDNKIPLSFTIPPKLKADGTPHHSNFFPSYFSLSSKIPLALELASHIVLTIPFVILPCALLGIRSKKMRTFAKGCWNMVKMESFRLDIKHSLKKIRRPLIVSFEKITYDNEVVSSFFSGDIERETIKQLLVSGQNLEELNLENCGGLSYKSLSEIFSWLTNWDWAEEHVFKLAEKHVADLKRITLPPLNNIKEKELKKIPLAITSLRFSAPIDFSTLSYVTERFTNLEDATLVLGVHNRGISTEELEEQLSKLTKLKTLFLKFKHDSLQFSCQDYDKLPPQLNLFWISDITHFHQLESTRACINQIDLYKSLDFFCEFSLYYSDEKNLFETKKIIINKLQEKARAACLQSNTIYIVALDAFEKSPDKIAIIIIHSSNKKIIESMIRIISKNRRQTRNAHYLISNNISHNTAFMASVDLVPTKNVPLKK